MTLTLELPPRLENYLFDEAARAGTDPASVAVRHLLDNLNETEDFSSLSERELLQRIGEGMPDGFWERYDLLSAKRAADDLTSDQHQELIALNDELEQKNADRYGWLSELASRKGLTAFNLMEQLGICPHVSGGA